MTQAIKILVADGASEMRKTIRDYLGTDSRLKIAGECSDGKSAVKMVLDIQPDVVLLDMDLPELEGVSAAEMISTASPGILIIMTSARKGTKYIKKAMAAGAREFIGKPFSSYTLINTIVDIYTRSRKNASAVNSDAIKDIEIKPKIITIFSTKGGVGKTTISVNLAVEVARITGQKVVLLDFDFQFGDIPILMNLYPKKTIIDLCSDIQNLDAETIEECLMTHESGVKVLPSPLSPEYAEFITVENVDKILKVLMENYKYLIIDTAPSFNDVNLSVLDISHEVLFIANQDIHTIRNVKEGFQVMKTLKYPESKISLVLNRYHSNYGINKSDLEKALERKAVYIIPQDNILVDNSINKGRPFAMDRSRNSLKESIKGMAAAVSSSYANIEEKSFFQRIIDR